MANKLRQYHPGYWYHIYARGLEEVPLFTSDKDRVGFINRLDDVFGRQKLRIGALSLVKIVLNDRYMLQLVPYIHNNAVKAGLVSRPEDYLWHSDGMYRKGSWEQVSLKCWEYPPNFTGKNRKKLYIELLEKTPNYPKQSGEYIGDIQEWKKLERRNQEYKDRFLDRRNRRSMEEITVNKAKKGKITVQKLKSPGRSQPAAKLRQEAMVEMYNEGYGPAQIGRYFNRDKGTVVYAVKKEKNQL